MNTAKLLTKKCDAKRTDRPNLYGSSIDKLLEIYQLPGTLRIRFGNHEVTNTVGQEGFVMAPRDSIWQVVKARRLGELVFSVVAVLAGCGGDAAAVDSPGPPSISKPPSDTTPPSAPLGLAATPVSSSRIDLAWKPSADDVGVDHYQVYRDGLPIGSTTLTTHSVTSLTPVTSYSFSVQALDAAGNVSPMSAAATATTLAASPSVGRVLSANPNNYASIVPTLIAGDTLVLEPGIYRDASMPGLRLRDLSGTAAAPITIMGDPRMARPVLHGRGDVNTVRFRNSSYIVLRYLEIDSLNLGGDGVRADSVSHHITLEDLIIRGVGLDQATVGISTNGGTTWNWIIRRCVIDGAGTGMYLGNSAGDAPFIAGIIENNLILNSLGYNIQIKHQFASLYPRYEGMPTGPSSTIIRNNVFHKSGNSSTGTNARPNLLVGSFPLTGAGSQDRYEIYGNFFYQNPTERLFQGEGSIAFHHNLLVNSFGGAMSIQRHNGEVRSIRIFNNSIVAAGTGISVTGGATGYAQRVTGNAVFAATPIVGGEQTSNQTDSMGNASKYLANPLASLGSLDLYPLVGALQGDEIDKSGLDIFADWDRDFNGNRQPSQFRGAYGGAGANPGWRPTLEVKP